MLERIHTESTLHERDPGTLAAAAARPAQTALPPAALGLAWRTRATRARCCTDSPWRWRSPCSPGSGCG